MHIVWISPNNDPHHFGRGRKIRILLDDIYTYTAKIKFVPGEIINRDTVKLKASEKIPDNLDNLVWDYIGDSGNIQIVALVKVFTDELKKQNLDIEAIEPVSYSLARMAQSITPTIIVYNSERPLLIALEKSKIVAVETFDKPIEEKDFANFVSYTKDFFTADLSKIIVSGNLGFQIAPQEGVIVETRILDPIEGLRRKNDLKKIDSQNLILTLGTSLKRSIIRLLILLLVLSIALLAGVFVFKNYKNFSNISPTKKIATPTVFPTQIPTATPTQAQKKNYQISVLNGSGITGEAKKVADILTAMGLQVSKTGNADNANYQQTVIQYKDTVDPNFIDTIDTELKKLYTVNKQVVNNNTEPSDVIVIIGKLKK
jgi:hypothetical protein